MSSFGTCQADNAFVAQLSQDDIIVQYLLSYESIEYCHRIYSLLSLHLRVQIKNWLKGTNSDILTHSVIYYLQERPGSQ